MEIAQQLNGIKLPTLICSSGVLPAKIFQSLAKGEGLAVQGLLSLGSISEHYAVKSLDILSGKMLKALCLHEADGILPTSLVLFPKVGIISGGKFSTPKISVCLKTESVSLSSVLETKVPKKYFLSQKIQDRLKLWEQPKEKKIPESESGTQSSLLVDWGGALKATDYKQPPQILVCNKGESQHYRLYDENGLAPTLQSQSGMSSQKHPFIMAQRGRPQVLSPKRTEYGKQIRKDYESGKIKEQRKNIQKLEPRSDGVSNTLTGVEKDNYVFDGQVRRLMPIECERLMSWPDNWTKWGIDNKGNKVEISDSQRYKMCGNGVVSNCVREIIKALF